MWSIAVIHGIWVLAGVAEGSVWWREGGRSVSGLCNRDGPCTPSCYHPVSVFLPFWCLGELRVGACTTCVYPAMESQLGKELSDRQTQTQPTVPTDHVPKCHISNTSKDMDTGYLQGWELPHLLEQPVPLHHHSLENELILISNQSFPLHWDTADPTDDEDGLGSAGSRRRVCGTPARAGKQEKPAARCSQQ